jgi:hypothetical protein
MSNSADSTIAKESTAWPWGTVIGVSLSLLLFVALVGMLFWSTTLNRSDLLTEGKTPEQKLQELQAEDRMTLANYGWIDRTKGVVRIPIDRAMTLLIKERNTDDQAPPAQIPAEVPQR